MKAVLWISFLLFAAFMGGVYYYYDKVYAPKQAQIEAAAEAERAQMQADIEAERARIERRKATPPPAPTKKVAATKPTESELDIKIPKARAVSTLSNSIPDSLVKAKPKTPEEIKAEAELAKLREHLRAMKAEGEKGS